MKNFHFITGNELNEEQLDQVAHLLFETGYYELASLKNKLNLKPIAFQKVQTLKPYAEYTHILICDDDVVGFFIAAKRDEIAEVEHSTPNWYRDENGLASAFHRINHFYTREVLDTDYVVYATAVAKPYRGSSAYKTLINYRKNLGRANHCTREVFVVWESNRAAKLFMKHEGAEILGTIDCTDMCFKDTLLKGAWDI